MSTTFSITVGDIVNASLRTLGVLGTTGTASSTDLTNCMQSLNILLKDMGKDAFFLWKQKEVSLPMVASTASYQIGPTATGTGALVTDRITRILDAFIRDANNNDTRLQIVSKQEYNMLGDKTSLGVPNQIMYDNLIPNGIVYVYNVPSDATRTIHLIGQIGINDITTSTDGLDVTQEAYRALKWMLADELALEYGVSQTTLTVVGQKAALYRSQLDDWSQEETSVFFQASPRYGRQ